RLRAWRRAIHLIREHDVGEERPLAKLKLADLLVVKAQAGDIAGQQIGGALDARKCGVEGTGERARQHCLSQTWNVLDERMPLAEKRNQQEPDDLALADDHAIDVLDDPLRDFRAGLRVARL